MSPAYPPHLRNASRVPTPGLPGVAPIHVIYATPLTSVGASACTQRMSGQFDNWLNWKFAMTESSPTPLKPCAGVPPLNSTQMSDAGIPTIGDPSEARSEEHTSELQSRRDLVCRLLLEKKKNNT